ncbi:MAG: hypothetical protein EA384_12945 [Spirochaetaceae bacterium]|nr:MAG: hypothetical protein EA384_12945 [Spirochaetaceae bacterium]
MAPPLWWVESCDEHGPHAGKGVAVRLAGAATGLARLPALLIHPGTRSVTLKSCAAESPADYGITRFAVTLKGAARRELRPGRLLYPLWCEQYNATAALVTTAADVPRSRQAGGEWRLLPCGVPAHVCETLQSAVHGVQAVRDRDPRLAHYLLLRIARPLPLIPGCDYELRHPGGSVRLRVELALPPATDAAAVVSGAGELLAEGASSQQVSFAVWGFCGSPDAGMHPELSARSIPSAQPPPLRIGCWWVSPDVVDRCRAALTRAAATHRGIGTRDAVAVVGTAVAGSGPAFGAAVVKWAAGDGGVLTKREGRYFPAGIDRDAILPPAARQLRAEIERSGRIGYDVSRSRHSNTRALIDSLQRLGMAVILDNARVMTPQTLDQLAGEAHAELIGSQGDLHQRRLARLWGLPRSSARAVTLRLIADGRLERASSVHVRLPRSTRRVGR